MIKNYPFIIIFLEDGVYGYFPDVKNVTIKAELVSTCLIRAKKELKEELKRYTNKKKTLPLANHISYYVCKEKRNYVTNITVDI